MGEKEGGPLSQPTACFAERFAEVVHHQVDGAAGCSADEAAVAVAAHREREAGMVVIVERTKALMPHYLESKSLCDPLNGLVAELLKF